MIRLFGLRSRAANWNIFMRVTLLILHRKESLPFAKICKIFVNFIYGTVQSTCALVLNLFGSVSNGGLRRLCNLPRLDELHVWNNNLMQTLPPTLDKLTRLQSLRV